MTFEVSITPPSGESASATGQEEQRAMVRSDHYLAAAGGAIALAGGEWLANAPHIVTAATLALGGLAGVKSLLERSKAGDYAH